MSTIDVIDKRCPRCEHLNDFNSAVCWVCKLRFSEYDPKNHSEKKSENNVRY